MEDDVVGGVGAAATVGRGLMVVAPLFSSALGDAAIKSSVRPSGLRLRKGPENEEKKKGENKTIFTETLRYIYRFLCRRNDICDYLAIKAVAVAAVKGEREDDFAWLNSSPSPSSIFFSMQFYIKTKSTKKQGRRFPWPLKLNSKATACSYRYV